MTAGAGAASAAGAVHSHRSDALQPGHDLCQQGAPADRIWFLTEGTPAFRLWNLH